MEIITDHSFVRLRSRVSGTYLHADEDGHGVSLHWSRRSVNAAWSVHIYHSDGMHLLLHSAAYGRYLAATAAPAPLAHQGFRAELRDYDQMQVQAIMWHAVWADADNYILLCDVADRCLRASEYINNVTWKIGVSVIPSTDRIDIVRTMMQMHWAVELIPSTDLMPRLPRPHRITVARPFAGIIAALAGEPLRRIMYVREAADGSRLIRGSFMFRGRSVYRLRKELARRRRLRANMNVTDFAVCVEAGFFGRPTPLVVDLPCSTRDLHVVVFEAGTPAHAMVRYPDMS